MSTINERVRHLRKSLGLTQTEFGNRIGVKIGVIRNFEYNITEPNSPQIDLICATYHVNRVWLETGEGEMLADMSKEEKIGRMIADILDDEPESFRRRVFDIITALDAEGWKKLQAAAELLAETYAKTKDEG